MNVLQQNGSNILFCMSSCIHSVFFFFQLFVERSKEHEKYGGDPDQPHKLHIVTRVKSVMRRPYWEKEMVKHLGLQKVRVCLIVVLFKAHKKWFKLPENTLWKTEIF